MHRRHLTALVLVPTLLAVLLAAPGAPSPARAEPPSDSAAAPVTRFRVVDHNIEHKPSALRAALEEIRRVGATAATFQEICWWQAAEIQRKHPHWTVAFKGEMDSGWCAKQPKVLGMPIGKERKRIGNAAIFTGGGRADISTFTFAHQLNHTQVKGLACVSWFAGARQRVCSLHLLSANEPRRRMRIRLKQAREVHRVTAPWIRKDGLVVLGGDLNSQPYKNPLDYFYAFRGRGEFREVTPRARGRRDCRCSQVTIDGGRTKIDYIFFSDNRMDARALRGVRVVPTRSDHHMLVGWADVDISRH